MTVALHDRNEAMFAAQSTFRAIMEAIARPGSLQRISGVSDAPAPLSGETAAIALALLDQDTPVWLDGALAHAEVAEWLRFQTGAPCMPEPASAAFALIVDPLRMPPLTAFNQGSAEYPDRSTTVVTQIASFADGETMILTGPGIRESQPFRATPLVAGMSERLIENRSLFPRGVDLLFAGSSQIAAIPRSSRLKRG